MTNTNQQQDGIEERANDCPHCEVAKEIGWAADHVCTETATLTAETATLSAQLEATRAALAHYEHICIECLSPQDEHDENGLVDMMDEIGRMICGNPKYPAKAILSDDKAGE